MKTCTNTHKYLFVLALLTLGLSACGTPAYVMDTPTGFVKYEDRPGLSLITADGVRLKVRETDNKPKADLAFWTDALKRHLIARGYAPKSENCFDTTRGSKGCTLEFLLPHGAEDWVLSETVFVVGDRIVLVEGAGPFPLWAKVEAGVKTALLTFDPGA